MQLIFRPKAKRLLISFLFFFVFYTSNAQIVKTEILWDNYGVPHIYAKSTEEMYYAFGWAQMQSHANLILQLYGQARGRAAEYWGKAYINSDKQILLFNLPEQAKKNYNKQDVSYKTYLDAFVKGLNDYAKSHTNQIGKEFQQVLPVTAYDVLAHTTRVVCLEFLGSGDIAISKRLITPGSNSIAIAPSRSASKKAMLLANPHLPWTDFFTFYEAHLNSPGFNAYGVSLVGFPGLNIAFNEHLGWTHTVNTIDASDRYELTLKDDGYLLDGKTLPFEKKSVTIKSRQDDGSIQEENLTFKYSEHGPVLGEKNGKAYAIRIAGLENAGMGEQYHKMGKAKSFAEFESAIKMLQNPMFNVVYADNAGNIMYLFNGNVPVRQEGDWRFWNSTVDGTSSKYIWSKTHSYTDLPKLFNPATGFVQNANDPPWTSTYPVALDPKKFPAYMSPLDMGLRPQRALNMIKDDASISFDELVGYKLNTEMEAAHRFLDDLLSAVEKYPDSLVTKAATVLKTWDKSSNAESKGAVLFEQWFNKLNRDMVAKPWNLAEPVSTPDGLKDDKKAVELLIQAAGEVLKKYGSLDVAYGDVNRFRANNIDYPGNGGTDRAGVFRTMYFREDKDKKNRAWHGDTYVAITEFSKKVKASVLLSYGNSSQPGSKYAGDQLQLLSQKKMRPALLEKADVLKNLDKKENISISDTYK
ncbi:MAG TPA: acylase [Chitinophagaceae bacterium]|nr:acylase [Chitinophagaceae bacterium]